MRRPSSAELLPGTLEMLILRVLALGAEHGFGIARLIQRQSDGALRIEEGSLYPALHRMEKRGVIEAEWRPSENNRRAKFYSLTAAGRANLKTKSAEWEAFAAAVEKVMGRASAVAENGA